MSVKRQKKKMYTDKSFLQNCVIDSCTQGVVLACPSFLDAKFTTGTTQRQTIIQRGEFQNPFQFHFKTTFHHPDLELKVFVSATLSFLSNPYRSNNWPVA